MRPTLSRYRGPIAAALVLTLGSGWWAWRERVAELERAQEALTRHADSLAQLLSVLLDVGGRSASAIPSEGARGVDRALALIKRQLFLRPPLRFIVIKRGRTRLSVFGAPAPTRLSPGLNRSGELLVVYRPLGEGARGDRAPWVWGAPAVRAPRPPPGAPPPPRPLATRSSSAGLGVYVGMDAGPPPELLAAANLRAARLLLLSWLSIGALLLTWVRSIRAEQLREALASERLRRRRLSEMNLAAAGLAHETKNPLGLILGLSHRLAEDPSLPAPLVERVDQITDEADRASARLSDFINFARITEVRAEVVSGAELVEAVVAALRPEFEDAGVGLELSTEPLMIRCDRALLEQLLVNLLMNALQASEEGSVTRVCFSRGARGGAILSVEDEGCGMEAERQEDNFKPYVSGRAGGHGLGLAIVKRVVEQHGWRLSLKSVVAEGTKIEIRRIEVVG